MPKLSPDQWLALSPRLDEALGMTDEERSIWFCTLRDEDLITGASTGDTFAGAPRTVRGRFSRRSPR